MAATSTILSTIGRVPISYFVYSALSYYGGRRGGELPGAWFVEALRVAGREPAAVRQTLYRMEHEGELETRRAGRIKFYRPSGYAAAEIEAGTSKIFAAPAAEWDGRWTLVRVGLRTPALATHRERVKALLAVEGFAQLDANLFVHPRARAGERLREALPKAARPEVVIVRGELTEPDAAASLIRLWPMRELARRYRKVIEVLARVDQEVTAGTSDPRAFLLRFAVVFEYLGVAWDEPDLPQSLLPPDWPGHEARSTAARLYTLLLPGAIRHADAIYEAALRPKKRGKGVSR